MSQVQKCKQLYADGESIREIARRLEISRNTVRRYLRGAEPGRYSSRASQSQPVRDRVKGRVRELLIEERDNNVHRKQRLTAARIHRFLTKEGLDSSERTVRTVVREVRMSLRDALKHAYLPLEYEPGKDAQVDFFEAEVDREGDGRVKVNVLLVRACYSTRTFRYEAPNQSREALLEGLMKAFEFFGGVFRNVWFDNLTPAVRKVLKGRERELQRPFEAFVAHYGFEAVFCAPGKGNEKGGVENAVRFTRSEGFSPVPKVREFGDMQRILDVVTEEELLRVPRRRGLTIGQLWKHEKPELMPLPAQRFEAGRLRKFKVTNRSWIQHGTNMYSVPVAFSGREVDVRIRAEEIVVMDQDSEIARHKRHHGRERMILNLAHYLPLLERKHRGLDRAVPVRQWLDAVPRCWTHLLEDLRRKLGEVEGSKQFVQALYLCERHGTAETTSAVRKTLASGSTGLPVIRLYLGLEREGNQPAAPTLDYVGPQVAQGSPNAYMEVLNA